jgi:hypothetical protein
MDASDKPNKSGLIVERNFLEILDNESIIHGNAASLLARLT